jgi:serine/threonine-protein kinase
MTTPGAEPRSRTLEPPPFARTATIDRGAPRAGEVIAGKYRVEEVIGVGGMGIVAAGTHLDLDQRVAIKFVNASAMRDEKLLERFLREARAAARLKSEHVAKVLDVGRLASGSPFMVMELLEGCDLGALLAKNGPLPFETAADFIAQACEAVAEAHARGIIHRDIKPQNLFLTTAVGGAALVKVLDLASRRFAPTVPTRSRARSW